MKSYTFHHRCNHIPTPKSHPSEKRVVQGMKALGVGEEDAARIAKRGHAPQKREPEEACTGTSLLWVSEERRGIAGRKEVRGSERL